MNPLTFCLNADMALEDNWMAHLRALVDTLAKQGDLRLAYREIADATGYDEEYIYQLYTGKSKKSTMGRIAAKKIGKAFANGRDESWINLPVGHEAAMKNASPAPHLRVVPQSVDLGKITVIPIVTWSQLMDGDLPDVFKVAIPDHSMSPRFKKDSLVEFTHGILPEPGDGVLVKDRAGTVYFREYRERRAGIWEAHAFNPAFGPMDAEAEGLTVFAVLTGFSGRLSQ